ncbi:hypothetical protein E2C01_057880 [Portunus trituberculatus]|uniref:Uncharacterized protein n=1 Tax=Portunus trituberculatus TaxID=210409 RepID=A0A5B7H365_PORTR|nr:hypothetical protein [Portunus trituberculatus]
MKVRRPLQEDSHSWPARPAPAALKLPNLPFLTLTQPPRRHSRPSLAPPGSIRRGWGEREREGRTFPVLTDKVARGPTGRRLRDHKPIRGQLAGWSTRGLLTGGRDHPMSS